MSDNVTFRDIEVVSDEFAEMIQNLPAGDDIGYQYAEESLPELRQVMALLQEAIPLLQRSIDREEPRYVKFFERIEDSRPPGGRPRLRLVKSGATDQEPRP